CDCTLKLPTVLLRFNNQSCPLNIQIQQTMKNLIEGWRQLPLLSALLAALTLVGRGANFTPYEEIPAPKEAPKLVNPGVPGGGAPADAIELFDGLDLSRWKSAKDGGEAKWVVRDGYAEINGTGDIVTKDSFGDCQLHVEWAAPAEVKGEGQA